jgi:O-antigen/teichoic acid export membrane protein
MSLGESIRHGAKWLLGGSVAGQALQFAFGVVLARLLVPADFGVLVTVQIFTGLAGFIAGGGTGQALVRAKETRQEDFQVVFTIQLVIGLLIYGAFFATAPLFARWYDQPLYTDLFRVSAISFILRPFSNLPNVWLTREMRFKQRMIVNLICATLGSMLSVVLAWHQYGVWSLVFGGMAGTVLSIIALMTVTPVRPAIRFNMALTKELGAYGLKVASNDFVSYVRNQTPNFFLGRLEGPAIVGLFNKAHSLAKTPRIVAGSVYDPVFRSLAKSQDNVDQSRYIYFRTVMLLSVYMMPLFIGLAWLAQPFIAFVYGPKWSASAAPLAILSMMGPLASIGYPSGAVLAARNWLGREIFVHLTQTALFAASCIIGIRWGLPGVAWGILLSEALSVLFIAFLVTRCLRSTFVQLGASLVPGLLLNLLLCVTLLLVDSLLPHGFREIRPFSYMLMMSASGALTYVAAFLFLPIPALASESARWKVKLRLSRTQHEA